MEPITPTRKTQPSSTDSSLENNGTSSSTPATTPPSTPNFELILAKHNLTKADLKKIHLLLIEIAMDGGQMMMDAELALKTAVGYKNNSADGVTEYDKKIEGMVEKRVRDAYPSFSFLGEETFKHGTKLTATPTFVCGPVDGTLNFTKGVPNCAISLALTLDKKPVIGVIYNPFRRDLYHAIKNQGAYLTKTQDWRQIKLSIHPVPPPMPTLHSCLVCVEWGNQRQGSNWTLRKDVHNKLLTSKAEGGAMAKSVRSNGSAALDFCYVAQGILDFFWEGSVWIWDVAGGWIILEEAGGIVASANPGDWDPVLDGRVYLAVRAAKREEQMGVVGELWGIMGDRKFVH